MYRVKYKDISSTNLKLYQRSIWLQSYRVVEKCAASNGQSSHSGVVINGTTATSRCICKVSLEYGVQN